MSAVVIAGNTSGTVTLDAPNVAGSTVLTLPTTSGTIVTTNTMPTGSILQVVNATYSTQTSTTSSTYTDTGLSASITPSSSSNKILVLTNNNGNYVAGGSTDAGMRFRLLRGATSIAILDEVSVYLDAVTGHSGTSVSTCYLDSPATTSSTTYKTQFHSRNNASNCFVNFGSSVSTITLMEIKG
jgi:hypothetical protein